MISRFFIFFLICFNMVFAQEKTVTYLFDGSTSLPEKPIDINHLEGHLSIDPYDTLVKGKVLFTFTPVGRQVDSIIFWSPDIRYENVSIPGIKSTFRKYGDNLVVYIPSGESLDKDSEYEIRMEYLSKPRYDLFFIGWNAPGERENKQIWAHRPFHWLPYYSDRLTADMYITFDRNYQVMSNGVRVSVDENGDGTNTWHYKMYREHPFFSTCLVVGDYSFLEWETSDGLPLELWYYTRQEDHAEPTYRYTPQMFDFFHVEFGMDYPYELYREAPVADYLYGAMETTTSTVFGDYLAVDERAFDGRNYVNVNAHELAHQWFGNCLSHQRNSDVWLTESFATYYAKLFEKEIFGDDYYQWVRDQELKEALDAAEKDPYPVGHGRGGRARWYPKGSLVLDMLRNVLGDEGFKDAVSYYTNHYKFSEVETSEFISSVYEATGKPMDWFFEQWIFRGGEPHYEVTWGKGLSPEGSNQVIIEIRQVHHRNELTGLFKMPVDVEVFFKDGSSAAKELWIEEEFTRVIIPVEEQKHVSFVLFDPGRKVLKKVTFNKCFDEWSAQALDAPGMIDRYDALLALRVFMPEIKEATLLKAWKKETFHLTRGEILNQLGDRDSIVNIGVFGQALADADPLVRRAALESMKRVPSSLKLETERLLTDKSYINVEKALHLLSKSFPQDIPKYLEATKNETGWRGMNVRMKWIEIALQVEQREYLLELVRYAGPAYEFETRINAFYLMKRLDYLDKKAASYLIDGYLYWNYKVSNAAKDVLTYFYQQNRHKALIDAVVSDIVLSGDDRKKVEKMLKAFEIFRSN